MQITILRNTGLKCWLQSVPELLLARGCLAGTAGVELEAELVALLLQQHHALLQHHHVQRLHRAQLVVVREVPQQVKPLVVQLGYTPPPGPWLQ